MFKIYVIFHKFLVPECYETLSGEDISEHVRFIEVNAAIPKEIPAALADLAPYIIQERELTWYNPFLQHNRFCVSFRDKLFKFEELEFFGEFFLGEFFLGGVLFLPPAGSLLPKNFWSPSNFDKLSIYCIELF